MEQTKELLKKFLSGLLRVQSGEGKRTAFMFGLFTCVVGSFILGRVVRDSLFLSRYSVSYLPYIYIWVAVGSGVLAYLYSHIADRFSRDRTVTVTLMIIIALILIARLSLLWAGKWFYPVLYVFVELSGTLLLLQVWTLANDVFTTREAKRLFGVVGAGGVISSVIVGFSSRGMVKIIGIENLLFLCALLLVVGLIFILKISRECHQDILASLMESRRQTHTRIVLWQDWIRVLKNRQLLFIAGLVLLLGAAITFIDYQFKVIAKKTFTDEYLLAGFFSMFWAVTGIINCLIQFFLTGRIIERFGILLSLLLLPITLLAGAMAFLVSPLLWSATFLKGGDAVLRYTLNDATLQLLYFPIPGHFRGRAKAFIDGLARPLSIGLSGIVIAWILKKTSPAVLDWVLVGLLVCWIVLVFGVRRQYFSSLMHTLRTRRLHFGEMQQILPDQAAVHILGRALQDSEEQNILHALDLVRLHPGADWSEHLVRLPSHPSPTVRSKVIRLLGEQGSLSSGQLVYKYLNDIDPQVRSAAVEAYCAIGKERAIQTISRYLEDPDKTVQSAAVIGLIRYCGLDGILSSAERLKKLYLSELPEERAVGATILGAIGVKNFYHPILPLIVDPELEVRIAAIKAAGQIRSRELLPAVIYRIEDPTTRVVASDALVRFGSPAIKLLQRVLDNPDEHIATKLAIPPILSRIGNQEALDVLVEHLNEPQPPLSTQILECIHRMRVRKPHLNIPREKARNGTIKEIRNLYQQWFVLWDVDLPDDNILVEALGHQRQLSLKRIFRLLGCTLPVRTIDAVYNSLTSTERRIRSNAIEVLEDLADKEIKRLLIPLLDDGLVEQRKSIGAEIFGLVHQDRKRRLVSLMEENHKWLSSCALFIVGNLKMEELLSEIMVCTASDHPVIRETSLLTLSKIVSAEKLRNTANRHLQDSSLLVRNFAKWLLHDETEQNLTVSSAPSRGEISA